MSGGLLAWQDGSAGHRGALQTFTCTTFKPPSRLRSWPPLHLKDWWEYEVQLKLRDLRPPCGHGRHVRLGFDGSELGAVSYLEELDGPGLVEMALGAVALPLRHKGGGYADEMFRDSLDVLTGRAVEASVPEVVVVGYIFEANRPSQELCRRHGFQHVGSGGDGVQMWQMRLPTAE